MPSKAQGSLIGSLLRTKTFPLDLSPGRLESYYWASVFLSLYNGIQPTVRHSYDVTFLEQR